MYAEVKEAHKIFDEAVITVRSATAAAVTAAAERACYVCCWAATALLQHALVVQQVGQQHQCEQR
jgi:hypothetical protein